MSVYLPSGCGLFAVFGYVEHTHGFGEILRDGELRVVEEGGDEVLVFGTDDGHLLFDFLGHGELVVETYLHGFLDGGTNERGNLGVVFDEGLVTVFASGLSQLCGVFGVDGLALGLCLGEELVYLSVGFLPAVDGGLEGFEVLCGVGCLYEERAFGGAVFVVRLEVSLLLVFGQRGQFVKFFAGESCGELCVFVGGIDYLCRVGIGGGQRECFHGETENLGLEGGDRADHHFEGLLVEFGFLVADELLDGGQVGHLFHEIGIGELFALGDLRGGVGVFLFVFVNLVFDGLGCGVGGFVGGSVSEFLGGFLSGLLSGFAHYITQLGVGGECCEHEAC